MLLILAGVAISLTIGQNGIFARAQNAVNVYEQATANEQSELGKAEDIIDEYLNGQSQSNSKSIVQAFKDGEIKIGDYVNYQNPASGSYTSPANKNGVADQNFTVDTNMQWRVLGLSEDGNNLLLVSNSPMKRGEVSNPNTGNGFDSYEEEAISKDYYFYMHGAEGAYYATDNEQGEGELDKISAIYKNNLAEEVRSMTAEDINNLLGLTVVETGANAGVYKKSEADSGNYSNNWDGYGVLGEKCVYRHSNDRGEEDQIPETALGLKEISEIPEEYYTTGINGTAYYYSINTEEIGITQTIYDMLFKGTEDYDEKPYWLASSGVFVDFGIAGFGPGAVNYGRIYRGDGTTYYSSDRGALFNSYGGEHYRGLAVRPVVSLKSGISVDDIKVISGTEDTETWPEHGWEWSPS